MRALFGVVSLLVVLAIVGVLAMKQTKAVNSSVGNALPPAQSGTESGALPAAASTPRAQSEQLQQRVKTDVQKALEQGAARSDASDK
jgi:hypothetical protein